MAYYDSEDVYRHDVQLAEYIAHSVAKDVESKYNCYANNRKDEIPIHVQVCKLKDSVRSSYSDGYSEYELCHESCENIYLIDTCCSFDTLAAAAKDIINNLPKGFHYAIIEETCHGESDYEKSFVYLFFKNSKSINFANVGCAENAKLNWTSDPEFDKKFKNRNLDIKIDEYKRLIRSRDDYKRSYDRYVNEIEKFKKGLTEEELLAISVVDQ